MNVIGRLWSLRALRSSVCLKSEETREISHDCPSDVEICPCVSQKGEFTANCSSPVGSLLSPCVWDEVSEYSPCMDYEV
jgi:hypothetical protein